MKLIGIRSFHQIFSSWSTIKHTSNLSLVLIGFCNVVLQKYEKNLKRQSFPKTIHSLNDRLRGKFGHNLPRCVSVRFNILKMLWSRCFVFVLCFCSIFVRLWGGWDGSWGEGGGHWRQFVHTGLEENARGHWVQDHLEPLPRWAQSSNITSTTNIYLSF